MRPIALYIACAFIGLLPVRMLSAQGRHGGKGPAAASQPLIVVKATVDKQKILIGQPIQLMLEVTMPNSEASPGPPLTWPDLDSLPHFEWVEKHPVDSVVHPGDRYYRQYLTVTSFDSGAWSIPRLPFLAGNKKYLSDSVRIEVVYTPIDPSKDYHDIKDIIDIPNPFAKWIGWIVAAVTIGSLVLVIWLIRKKKIWKIITGAAPAPRLSPYEEAIRQLEELERQHLPENGSVKVYYTRLSEILRLFLFRRLGVSSLAETSEELIVELRRLPVAEGQFTEIAETLRMSDFVKFAKYQPGLADSEHHFRVTRGAIELLEKAGQEAEEEARREERRVAMLSGAVGSRPEQIKR
jgi:hypothetical protein